MLDANREDRSPHEGGRGYVFSFFEVPREVYRRKKRGRKEGLYTPPPSHLINTRRSSSSVKMRSPSFVLVVMGVITTTLQLTQRESCPTSACSVQTAKSS